ncbi:oligoendopeptidase [Ornatilinea apprima]|uniref:Oligoendopeptidase n=1 Tax=Ornatilinea apprima TaxID=1134406 RepID=A0A0P6XK81_9CHLR|nr:M3 family oligoendopeptidase [Ornatilinea apprima]KPL80592.1 oligoendopeptidase [Ornatilinea apprima]
MTGVFPESTEALMKWEWSDFAPHYQALIETQLSSENLQSWLAGWSRISEHLDELYNRLYVAHSAYTADHEAEARFDHFMDTIFPPAMSAEQALKEKLVQSGLEPAGFEIPLRNMRSEAELFRKENLPLQAREQKLCNEYEKILGAQTVEWNGQELTLLKLLTETQSAPRDVREKAWRMGAEVALRDREKTNQKWVELLDLRLQMAANAGKPGYRDYRWQQFNRFDYTPADCKRFHKAIEEVVVPASKRVYERHRQKMGVESIRPWDITRDPLGRLPIAEPPLKPFATIEELKEKASAVFHHVDPQLGEYFDTMAREGFLDLANRKNKASGAYCTTYAVSKRPFIFANAIGTHNDVQTTLHESGHAFHAFESFHLPYLPQTQTPLEFAEVASMGMELLATPYLTKDQGGFYTPQEAARAIVEHLDDGLVFWPYMATIDAFQHWVYENPEKAKDPANCDAAWTEQWQRFIPAEDWSGLEDVLACGWHRKHHIFTLPFYYIEYGLAQLGAVQVWANALKDQASALENYRKALRLGGTASLPKLYEAAGARLAFDAETLKRAVDLIEEQTDKLLTQIG